MQNYRKLSVWVKAHALAVAIHELTEQLPRRNNVELVDQMRRASHSVPTNIVEGAGSSTQKEFARFLKIAFASANELESSSIRGGYGRDLAATFQRAASRGD
jgi:four helix bundle protein